MKLVDYLFWFGFCVIAGLGVLGLVTTAHDAKPLADEYPITWVAPDGVVYEATVDKDGNYKNITKYSRISATDIPRTDSCTFCRCHEWTEGPYTTKPDTETKYLDEIHEGDTINCEVRGTDDIDCTVTQQDAKTALHQP